MNKAYQFNLESFFYVLKKRAAWIIIIGILAAAAVGVFGYLFITPEYSSTATFYVNTTKEQKTYLTQADLTVAKSLVSTYIVVIESDTSLERVASEAGVSYTPKQLRENIKAASISDTEAFSVTVTDPDPKVALKLANAIVKVAPDEILRVVEAGSVKIIDQPKEATVPDESGLAIFAAVAFVFGVLVSFTVFFLVEVLDVTVYTEEDLTRQFDYTVIGVIPTISSVETGKKEKRKNHGGGSSNE